MDGYVSGTYVISFMTCYQLIGGVERRQALCMKQQVFLHFITDQVGCSLPAMAAGAAPRGRRDLGFQMRQLLRLWCGLHLW